MNYITTVRDSGTGSFEFEPKCNNHSGFFQVSFDSGVVGSVSLYGRVSSTHEWYLLSSVTGDSIVEVAILPLMKFDWSVLNGSITASVAEAI